jgi:hypothetical protein
MHVRWLTRIAVTGVGGLITAAITVTPVAAAPAAATLAGVYGDLPVAASAAAPVRVVVSAIPGLAGTAVGDVETDPILTTQLVSSGSTFALAIPGTAAARALVSPTAGTLNIHTVAISAAGVTDTYATVKANAASPGTVDMGALKAYDSTLTRAYAALHGLAPVGPDIPIPPPCIWTTAQTVRDHPTRIGELHVAAAPAKVTATYQYYTHADSEFSIGVTVDGLNWTGNGTLTITNNTSTSEDVTRGAGYVKYIDAHFDYVRQTASSTLGCGGPSQRQMATNWDGDVFPGTNTPPFNPWGGCKKDPNGYAVLVANANWSHFSGSGQQYSGIASPMGFSFSGHTGYETGNGFTYHNPAGAPTTYLCSQNSPVGSWHIIYNNLS